MKKIFKEYEEEIKIRPIEETLRDVELIKKNKRIDDLKCSLKYIRRRKIIKWTSIIAVPALVIATFSVFMFYDIKDTDSVMKKNFSMAEIQNINKNTFKSLNEINYPKDLSKKNYSLDEKFIKGFNEFSHRIFEEGNQSLNFGYSPISLYHHLDILSGLANDSYSSLFDELLGGNSQIRDEQVTKNFLNNFYEEDNNGMSLYNGFFVNNDVELKKEKIDYLTKKYVEAFELNFTKQNDVALMLEWLNDKVELPLSIQDLEIKENTLFYLFSTMTYVNSWNTLFLKENTKTGTFYNKDGSLSDVKFMNHSYFGDLTDYGDYISFYDYYKNGYKIQYIYSKNKDVPLKEVINGVNYLVDDESESKNVFIDLKVPKFTFENNNNLDEILRKTEIGDIYNENKNSFNEMVLDTGLENSYLEFTKQQNKIEFNEDGTKIKTLVSSMAAGGMAEPSQGYQITLDHEFYFIIKDINNIPIFMGNYNCAN